MNYQFLKKVVITMEQNSLEELLQELKEQNDSLEEQVEIYKKQIEQLKKELAEKEQNN